MSTVSFLVQLNSDVCIYIYIYIYSDIFGHTQACSELCNPGIFRKRGIFIVFIALSNIYDEAFFQDSYNGYNYFRKQKLFTQIKIILYEVIS